MNLMDLCQRDLQKAENKVKQEWRRLEKVYDVEHPESPPSVEKMSWSGTRLSSARSSLDDLPASERTRGRIKTVVRRSYKDLIKEGLAAPSKSHFITKVKEVVSPESDRPKHSVRKNRSVILGKVSKLYPKEKVKTKSAFAIHGRVLENEVENLGERNRSQKIGKVQRTDKDLAKHLLKRAKQGQQQKHQLTETKKHDVGSPYHRKQFILPAQSSRSSRVIKPNKRFIEEDSFQAVVRKKTKTEPEHVSNEADTEIHRKVGRPKKLTEPGYAVTGVVKSKTLPTIPPSSKKNKLSVTSPVSIVDPKQGKGTQDISPDNRSGSISSLKLKLKLKDKIKKHASYQCANIDLTDTSDTSPFKSPTKSLSSLLPTSPFSSPKFGVAPFGDDTSPPTQFKRQRLKLDVLDKNGDGKGILSKAKLQVNRAALNRSKAALARSLKAQMKREAKMEAKRQAEDDGYSKAPLSSPSGSYMDAEEGSKTVTSYGLVKPKQPSKPKLMRCRVCGDTKLMESVSKTYYGVPSCDACRMFYRKELQRVAVRGLMKCKYKGRCKVTSEKKNFCNPCRFQICQAVFPSKEQMRNFKKFESLEESTEAKEPEESQLFLSSPVLSPVANQREKVRLQEKAEKGLKSPERTDKGFRSPDQEERGSEQVEKIGLPVPVFIEQGPKKLKSRREALKEILRAKQDKATKVENTGTDIGDLMSPKALHQAVPAPTTAILTSPESPTTSPKDTRGPRIKHVCRNAAVVLGKPQAKFPKSPNSELRLSALPVKEKVKILKKDEQEKKDLSDDERPLEEIIKGSENTSVIIHKSPTKVVRPQQGQFKTRKRKIRCQKCAGCLATDCGKCRNCLDKPKFGGRGVMKQACIHRKCRNPRYAKQGTVAFLDLKDSNQSAATSAIGTQSEEGGEIGIGHYNQFSPSHLSTSPRSGQMSRRLPTRVQPGGEVRRLTFDSVMENIGSVPSVFDSDVGQLPYTETLMDRTDGKLKKGAKLKEKALQPLIISEQVSLGVLSPTSHGWAMALEQHRIKADLKEQCSLEMAWIRGMALTMSGPPCVRAVCFLCGSAGKHELLYCNVCCEPFHDFCLDEDEVPSDSELENWCCSRCRFCNVCGQQNNLLQCDKCRNTYHPECLGPNYPTKPSKKKRIWICTKCVKCKSCGATTPGTGWNATWTHDFSLCFECGKLMDKGNFCPICRKCYTDDDWESKMVQCATCDSWVHAKCEGFTDEMYEILSYLPEDVSYHCRICKPNAPTFLHQLLKQEFVTGLDSALSGLLSSKCTQHLLHIDKKKIEEREKRKLQQKTEEKMCSQGEVTPTKSRRRNSLPSPVTRSSSRGSSSSETTPDKSGSNDIAMETEPCDQKYSPVDTKDQSKVCDKLITQSEIEGGKFDTVLSKEIKQEKLDLGEFSHSAQDKVNRTDSIEVVDLTSDDGGINEQNNVAESCSDSKNSQGSNGEGQLNMDCDKIESLSDKEICGGKNSEMQSDMNSKLDRTKDSNSEQTSPSKESLNSRSIFSVLGEMIGSGASKDDKSCENVGSEQLESQERKSDVEVRSGLAKQESTEGGHLSELKDNSVVINDSESSNKSALMDTLPADTNGNDSENLVNQISESREEKTSDAESGGCDHDSDTQTSDCNALTEESKGEDVSGPENVSGNKGNNFDSFDNSAIEQKVSTTEMVVDSDGYSAGVGKTSNCSSNGGKSSRSREDDSNKSEQTYSEMEVDLPADTHAAAGPVSKEDNSGISLSEKQKESGESKDKILHIEEDANKNTSGEDNSINKTGLAEKFSDSQSSLKTAESSNSETTGASNFNSNISLWGDNLEEIEDDQNKNESEAGQLEGTTDVTDTKTENELQHVDNPETNQPEREDNSSSKVGHVHFSEEVTEVKQEELVPYPHDLNAVRNKLLQNSYATVSEFVEDILRVIEDALSDPAEQKLYKKKANTSARSVFIKQIERCFPWYNIKSCSVWNINKNWPKNMLPDATLPPTIDHTYAQWLEREEMPVSPQPSPFKKCAITPIKNVLAIGTSEGVDGTPDIPGDDTRRCMMCLLYGDQEPNDAGRLLYAGQDDWVHVNCALWSAEVFEEVDGSMENFEEAVSRGRRMKCDGCLKPGATVGCCTRGCPANYHFMCARKDNCSFQEDKKVFCKNHRDRVDGELVGANKFRVLRRVYIDLRNIRFTKKPWAKGLKAVDISVMIGSCTVESLGQILPVSDYPDILLPLSYRCTRMYWSTKDCRRRTVYTCRITEVKADPLLSPTITIKDTRIVHDETHPDYVPLTELDLPGIKLLPEGMGAKSRNNSGESGPEIIDLTDEKIDSSTTLSAFSDIMGTGDGLSSSFSGTRVQSLSDSSALSSSWPLVKKAKPEPSVKSAQGVNLSVLSVNTLKLLNIKDPEKFASSRTSTPASSDINKGAKCKEVEEDFCTLTKIADRLNQAAARHTRKKSEERSLPGSRPPSRNSRSRSSSLERIIPITPQIQRRNSRDSRSPSVERVLSPASCLPEQKSWPLTGPSAFSSPYVNKTKNDSTDQNEAGSQNEAGVVTMVSNEDSHKQTTQSRENQVSDGNKMLTNKSDIHVEQEKVKSLLDPINEEMDIDSDLKITEDAEHIVNISKDSETIVVLTDDGDISEEDALSIAKAVLEQSGSLSSLSGAAGSDQIVAEGSDQIVADDSEQGNHVGVTESLGEEVGVPLRSERIAEEKVRVHIDSEIDKIEIGRNSYEGLDEANEKEKKIVDPQGISVDRPQDEIEDVIILTDTEESLETKTSKEMETKADEEESTVSVGATETDEDPSIIVVEDSESQDEEKYEKDKDQIQIEKLNVEDEENSEEGEIDRSKAARSDEVDTEIIEVSGICETSVGSTSEHGDIDRSLRLSSSYTGDELEEAEQHERVDADSDAKGLELTSIDNICNNSCAKKHGISEEGQSSEGDSQTSLVESSRIITPAECVPEKMVQDREHSVSLNVSSPNETLEDDERNSLTSTEQERKFNISDNSDKSGESDDYVLDLQSGSIIHLEGSSNLSECYPEEVGDISGSKGIESCEDDSELHKSDRELAVTEPVLDELMSTKIETEAAAASEKMVDAPSEAETEDGNEVRGNTGIITEYEDVAPEHGPSLKDGGVDGMGHIASRRHHIETDFDDLKDKDIKVTVKEKESSESHVYKASVCQNMDTVDSGCQTVDSDSDVEEPDWEMLSDTGEAEKEKSAHPDSSSEKAVIELSASPECVSETVECVLVNRESPTQTGLKELDLDMQLRGSTEEVQTGEQEHSEAKEEIGDAEDGRRTGPGIDDTSLQAGSVSSRGSSLRWECVPDVDKDDVLEMDKRQEIIYKQVESEECQDSGVPNDSEGTVEDENTAWDSPQNREVHFPLDENEDDFLDNDSIIYIDSISGKMLEVRSPRYKPIPVAKEISKSVTIEDFAAAMEFIAEQTFSKFEKEEIDSRTEAEKRKVLKILGLERSVDVENAKKRMNNRFVHSPVKVYPLRRKDSNPAVVMDKLHVNKKGKKGGNSNQTPPRSPRSTRRTSQEAGPSRESGSSSRRGSSAGDSVPLHDKIAEKIKLESLAKSSPGEKGPFKCPKCKRMYRTKESYDKHIEKCDFEVSTSEEEEEEDGDEEEGASDVSSGRSSLRKSTMIQRVAIEKEEEMLRGQTVRKRGRPRLNDSGVSDNFGSNKRNSVSDDSEEKKESRSTRSSLGKRVMRDDSSDHGSSVTSTSLGDDQEVVQKRGRGRPRKDSDPGLMNLKKSPGQVKRLSLDSRLSGHRLKTASSQLKSKSTMLSTRSLSQTSLINRSFLRGRDSRSLGSLRRGPVQTRNRASLSPKKKSELISSDAILTTKRQSKKVVMPDFMSGSDLNDSSEDSNHSKLGTSNVKKFTLASERPAAAEPENEADVSQGTENKSFDEPDGAEGSNEPPAKRGRGRPPKRKFVNPKYKEPSEVKSVAKIDEARENTGPSPVVSDTKESPSVEPSVKKGRGRPRKYPRVQSENEKEFGSDLEKSGSSSPSSAAQVLDNETEVMDSVVDTSDAGEKEGGWSSEKDDEIMADDGNNTGMSTEGTTTEEKNTSFVTDTSVDAEAVIDCADPQLKESENVALGDSEMEKRETEAALDPQDLHLKESEQVNLNDRTMATTTSVDQSPSVVESPKKVYPWDSLLKTPEKTPEKSPIVSSSSEGSPFLCEQLGLVVKGKNRIPLFSEKKEESVGEKGLDATHYTESSCGGMKTSSAISPVGNTDPHLPKLDCYRNSDVVSDHTDSRGEVSPPKLVVAGGLAEEESSSFPAVPRNHPLSDSSSTRSAETMNFFASPQPSMDGLSSRSSSRTSTSSEISAQEASANMKNKTGIEAEKAVRVTDANGTALKQGCAPGQSDDSIRIVSGSGHPSNSTAGQGFLNTVESSRFSENRNPGLPSISSPGIKNSIIKEMLQSGTEAAPSSNPQPLSRNVSDSSYLGLKEKSPSFGADGRRGKGKPFSGDGIHEKCYVNEKVTSSLREAITGKLAADWPIRESYVENLPDSTTVGTGKVVDSSSSTRELNTGRFSEFGTGKSPVLSGSAENMYSRVKNMSGIPPNLIPKTVLELLEKGHRVVIANPNEKSVMWQRSKDRLIGQPVNSQDLPPEVLSVAGDRNPKEGKPPPITAKVGATGKQTTVSVSGYESPGTTVSGRKPMISDVSNVPLKKRPMIQTVPSDSKSYSRSEVVMNKNTGTDSISSASKKSKLEEMQTNPVLNPLMKASSVLHTIFPGRRDLDASGGESHTYQERELKQTTEKSIPSAGPSAASFHAVPYQDSLLQSQQQSASAQLEHKRSSNIQQELLQRSGVHSRSVGPLVQPERMCQNKEQMTKNAPQNMQGIPESSTFVRPEMSSVQPSQSQHPKSQFDAFSQKSSTLPKTTAEVVDLTQTSSADKTKTSAARKGIENLSRQDIIKLYETLVRPDAQNLSESALKLGLIEEGNLLPTTTAASFTSQVSASTAVPFTSCELTYIGSAVMNKSSSSSKVQQKDIQTVVSTLAKIQDQVQAHKPFNPPPITNPAISELSVPVDVQPKVIQVPVPPTHGVNIQSVPVTHNTMSSAATYVTTTASTLVQPSTSTARGQGPAQQEVYKQLLSQSLLQNPGSVDVAVLSNLLGIPFVSGNQQSIPVIQTSQSLLQPVPRPDSTLLGLPMVTMNQPVIPAYQPMVTPQPPTITVIQNSPAILSHSQTSSLVDMSAVASPSQQPVSIFQTNQLSVGSTNQQQVSLFPTNQASVGAGSQQQVSVLPVPVPAANQQSVSMFPSNQMSQPNAASNQILSSSQQLANQQALIAALSNQTQLAVSNQFVQKGASQQQTDTPLASQSQFSPKGALPLMTKSTHPLSSTPPGFQANQRLLHQLVASQQGVSQLQQQASQMPLQSPAATNQNTVSATGQQQLQSLLAANVIQKTSTGKNILRLSLEDLVSQGLIKPVEGKKNLSDSNKTSDMALDLSQNTGNSQSQNANNSASGERNIVQNITKSSELINTPSVPLSKDRQPFSPSWINDMILKQLKSSSSVSQMPLSQSFASPPGSVLPSAASSREPRSHQHLIRKDKIGSSVANKISKLLAKRAMQQKPGILTRKRPASGTGEGSDKNGSYPQNVIGPDGVTSIALNVMTRDPSGKAGTKKRIKIKLHGAQKIANPKGMVSSLFGKGTMAGSPMKKGGKLKKSFHKRKSPQKPRNIAGPHALGPGIKSHPILHHSLKELTSLPQPALEEEVQDTPLNANYSMSGARGQEEDDQRKNGPNLQFEIISDDGFSCKGNTLDDAWRQVTDKVQDARGAARLKQLSYGGLSGLSMFGLNHSHVMYLTEQLLGAANCRKYKFRYHLYDKKTEEEIHFNASGCARSEPFKGRKPYDMFSFLMSKYRRIPPPSVTESDVEMVHKSSRRATSMDLPMAMRFRKLQEHAKEAVGVYRSRIHGRGLFCKRNIDGGEMVIEYSGEVIRSSLTDKREKYYESKGIGCYMFRIDDMDVVDATMHGSAARFINHSCEPNCYSKVITIDGRKHIVIFAMRPIKRGEELTYDYKFPIEEVKIPCTCGSRRCRKYLN